MYSIKFQIKFDKKEVPVFFRSQIVLQTGILKSGVTLSAWKSMQMPCQRIKKC
jgi:hypothetical protein